MQDLAVINIGSMISGLLHNPVLEADTLVIRNGVIVEIGEQDTVNMEDCAVLDAQGMTVVPGLVDSHCHVVLGDYTPRQKTVDFLESYTHGGVTSVISAGEIHAPGRPSTPVGVKALAIAAHQCFAQYRPAGMKVHGGSVILEPGLTESDFAEMAAAGVWLAKMGFGGFAQHRDAYDQIRWAQSHGFVVMAHTGGASIPGSKPLLADDLLALQPDIAGHVNGGPTALSASDRKAVLAQSACYLQLVQAGNLKAALEILHLALADQAANRVLIASDTPTGTGVIPLALLKSMAELCSLSDLSPEWALAMATGNVSRAFRLPLQGALEVGRQGDIVLMDTPWGSVAKTACAALGIGDIPGIATVIMSGQVRVWRSRNTPAPMRMVVWHRQPSVEWGT